MLKAEHERVAAELALEKNFRSRNHIGPDRFLEVLMNSLKDGISFYDKAWNLRYGNPAFYSITGLNDKNYSPGAELGLIHPDDRNLMDERVAALEKGDLYECELRVIRPEGVYRNLLLRSFTVHNENDEIAGFLVISQDVTLLKQLRDNMMKAKTEAEASRKVKSSFLANISHEIRTPLNSVVGFSNLLMTEDISREARAEYIDHISYNSEKLLQIISDIIDLSRLESSEIEIHYEEASLNSIIREVEEETRQTIKRTEKPIIFTIKDQFKGGNDLIFTDRIWLKRVLSHLMDNAVKFTLDGTVELSYMLEAGKLVFRIKDTGIGIKEENLKRVFEEFSQEIDGHHRPFEGLGIGLTLAKEVVERMGGMIFVKSEKGLGSEFSFSIPYRPAGHMKIKTGDVNNRVEDWSSKKCLIIDENRDFPVYMKKSFEETGIKILSARTVADAIQIVRTISDLSMVILDMQMPGIDGIEVTRKIRKINNTLPIIVQTAFTFENDRDIIFEAGCDACLLKPVLKDQLERVMKQYLS